METFKKYILLFISHIKTPNRGFILFLTLDSIVKEVKPSRIIISQIFTIVGQSTNCVEKCMHLRFSMISGIDFNVG